MKYIKEIDGLRAIAIILVILYHLGFPMFSGGYIGVDIFFVISGFLITSIILPSVNNNDFSILDFFSRRIRRIFPILFFVLIVTTFFSYFLLKPQLFYLFINSSISSALFFSNFFFYSKTGYFDQLSYDNPLFHTWSLSLEEQFYIFFPLLILVIHKFFNRRYFYIFFILIIISLSASITLFNINKNASFYFTPSRVWELFFGGMIAVLPPNIILFKLIYRKILSLLGFIFVLLSLIIFDENSIHPGIITILPVLGSSLIILFANQQTFFGKILASKTFSFVGLISYSLYLWHIPLNVFLKIVINPNSIYFVIIYFFLLFTISYFSYTCIEVPIKNKIKFKSHNLNVFFFCFIPIFILSSIYIFMFYNKKYKISNEYYVSQNDWYHPGALQKAYIDGLWVTNSKSEIDLLFFGDSHIEQYAPLALDFSKIYNKNIGFYSKGGCPPLPNIIESKHPDCNSFFTNFLNILEKNKNINKVVISGYFNSYFNTPNNTSDKLYDDFGYKYFQFINKSKIPLVESFEKNKAFDELKLYLKKYKHINFYFILDNPRSYNFDPNTHLDYKFDPNSEYFNTNFTNFNSIVFKYYDYQKSIQHKIVNSFSEVNNISFLNIADFICPNGNCNIFKSGNFIYKDNNHLRPFFVKNYLRIPIENFIFKSK
jgi:peptidoglycan/LPS O-acetylase OafA/YrhL